MVSKKHFYNNTAAVLTTMHSKERVIEPILRKGIGLSVKLATGVNTDKFGTFSREVARLGSQLDAARAKIAVGFEYMPAARFGLASEGSFGPHPYIPFLAVGRELVLMVDQVDKMELTGHDLSSDTNFENAVVQDRHQAFDFAQRTGFPAHGLIVMGCRDGQPASDVLFKKDIVDSTALEEAVQEAIKRCGAAFVETDMRAHRNPTRMAAIERATRDLVRRFFLRCPNCGHRGFDVMERIPGLPCASCGDPTHVTKSEALICQLCGHRTERAVATQSTADPVQCHRCNP